MKKSNKIMGLLFSVSLIFLLILPTLRWFKLRAPDGSLYGYTDTIPPAPNKPLEAFFDRSLQRWLEKYFEVNLGFRAILVRSFNELNFRLFSEAPRLRLYTTPFHGLYSQMSIQHLNEEDVRWEQLAERYRSEAKKILLIQQHFEKNGKLLQVVIATSKPYVYPDELGVRFLVNGAAGIFGRAASFGNALQEVGVNVIDGGPLLRDFVARTGVETHSTSGVHWNYYAGCLIARKLLDRVRTQFPEGPKMECGEPTLSESRWVDIDGLLLLNIWSYGGIKGQSPYPIFTPLDGVNWRPRITFIGDSFSDQIRYTLQQSKAYSRMVTSGYFRTREVDEGLAGSKVTHSTDAAEDEVRATLLRDIADSDVVVLEMADYNVGRFGYGFPDYILETVVKRKAPNKELKE